MDNLTSEQYETVLKYLEITDQDDIQQAFQNLLKTNFNLEKAITLHTPTPQAKISKITQQNDEQKVLDNYINYVQKQAHSRKNIKNLVGKCSTVCATLTQRCLGFIPCLQQTVYGPKFNSFYTDKLSITVSNNLSRVLLQKNVKKPIIVIYSSKQTVKAIEEFLSAFKYSNELNKNFEVIGVVEGSSDSEKYLRQYQAPCILIFKKSITDNFELIQKYSEPQMNDLLQKEQIQYINKKFEKYQKRDLNVLEKYRNQNNQEYLFTNIRSQFITADDNSYQEENIVVHEEVNDSSKMIKEQNQIYKQFAIQQKKKQQEKRLQQQRQQQLLEQRQIRKMSIPDEPQQGQIVSLIFRCPNGETIKRNFPLSQKLELVYNWVDTSDEIIFQNDKNRQFELFTSYPPISLSDRKQEFLKDIFQQKQQKIMIRQL